MSPRAVLKVGLLCIVVFGGVAIVVLLLAAPGPRSDPVPAVWNPPDPELVSEGRKLFLRSDARFGCALCHGRDHEGGTMGPALVGLSTFYRKRFGGDSSRARARLAAHLDAPTEYPGLMDHGREFLAPMPAYPNLTPEELSSVLAYLLSIE